MCSLDYVSAIRRSGLDSGDHLNSYNSLSRIWERDGGENNVPLSVGGRRPSGNVPDETRLLAFHRERLSPSFGGNNEVTWRDPRSEEIRTGELEDAVGAGMKVARHRTIGEVGSTPGRKAGGDESFTFYSYVATMR